MEKIIREKIINCYKAIGINDADVRRDDELMNIMKEHFFELCNCEEFIRLMMDNDAISLLEDNNIRINSHCYRGCVAIGCNEIDESYFDRFVFHPHKKYKMYDSCVFIKNNRIEHLYINSYGKNNVIIRGDSNVTIMEQYYNYKYADILIKDDSILTLHSIGASVIAEDNSILIIEGDSIVTARGNSAVYAYKDIHVIAYDSTTINLYNDAIATIPEGYMGKIICNGYNNKIKINNDVNRENIQMNDTTEIMIM